jgi:hypothetical protein
VICLTGDIHHATLGTGNQAHCDLSEVQVAREYLGLLSEADIKVTFFVSGRTFDEEWVDLQPICDHPLVEIGGHNYSCFKPEWWHRFWNKAIGSYNGPRWYQRWDADRTKRAIRRRTGRDIELWRNHMYMHGPNTEEVLHQCGMTLCSDGVCRAARGPTLHPAGIYNFPLNVIPDHEHLYHAERTPEWVDRWVKRYNWSDDFGPNSYYVEEWTDIVIECLEENERRGAISNMIIHPITLYLCDRFRSLHRILDYLAAHETVHLSEALAKAPPARKGASDAAA